MSFFSSHLVRTGKPSVVNWRSLSVLLKPAYGNVQINKHICMPKLTHQHSLVIHRHSTSSTGGNTGGNTASWIDNSSLIPQPIKPYFHLARMDKQVGTLLLMWPCFWSVALAAPMGSFPDPLLLSKFAVGALIMRGAGCTINDLWDRDFDKHVERTKSRPLASGDVSVRQALGFLALQLSAGLGVLLTFDNNSIILGMLSMPLVVAYPAMKRLTNWPQLVLGLTFNWGALMGWSAVHGGALSLPHTLPLYLSGVCWTLIYDTLYGYQDRKDDRAIGLKSTSLHLGDHPQWPLTGISAGLLGGLLLTGFVNDLSLPYYLGSGAMWGHSLWQIWTARVDDGANLWRRFSSNKYSGGLFTLAVIAGHF